jgi:hypothetical protein
LLRTQSAKHIARLPDSTITRSARSHCLHTDIYDHLDNSPYSSRCLVLVDPEVSHVMAIVSMTADNISDFGSMAASWSRLWTSLQYVVHPQLPPAVCTQDDLQTNHSACGKACQAGHGHTSPVRPRCPAAIRLLHSQRTVNSKRYFHQSRHAFKKDYRAAGHAQQAGLHVLRTYVPAPGATHTYSTDKQESCIDTGRMRTYLCNDPTVPAQDPQTVSGEL